MATLLKASLADTVTVIAVPPTALAGVTTERWVAAPGVTVMAPLVPVHAAAGGGCRGDRLIADGPERGGESAGAVDQRRIGGQAGLNVAAPEKCAPCH